MRAVALAVLMMLAAPTAAAEKLSLARLFADPALSGPAPRGLKLAPDGTRVTYLRGKDTHQNQLDVWQYEIGPGRTRLLVDSDWLGGEQLSAEEQARRERARTAAFSGIIDYDYAPDGKRLLFSYGGELYLYEIARGGKGGLRQLTHGGGFATDPKISPRGGYVSFVRNQNLWLIELGSGHERQLTRDGQGTIWNGVAEFVADEEMDRHTGYWWAPDDGAIAFARVDESPVPLHRRVEYAAERTEVIEQRYPAAGEPNVRVKLGVITIAPEAMTPTKAGGEAAPVRWLDLGSDLDIYLARVDWLPDGKRVSFQRQTRDQKHLDLIVADLATGEQRTLLSEHSATWIELNDDLRFLRQRDAFLWASEREGSKQLYLVGMDGKAQHRISTGDWPVDAVLALDERSDRVYVSAPGPDPLEKHAYAFPLGTPGTGVPLTAQPGFHEIAMSRDARYLLDTWSDPTHPPEARLLDRKGAQLAVLQPNALDERHPYAPYRALHRAPTYGTVQSVDGQTLHHGYVTPPDFDPAKRYPVILRYYGGPGRQFLTKAWTSGINTGFTDLLTQYWAQQGYIVFALDNRGTPRRDVAFGHAIHRQLGKAEIEDQLAGVDWLVQQPFVDPKRIGAFGWSYGGYQTLMLLGQASDRIAAGVAVAPVTDYALYDTHYTERYLELPTTNADGYAKTNVLSHLEGLHSPLLLVHGMADDNVLFQHSTLLMAELQKRAIPFELMLYPGAKHGILGQANRTHVYSTIDAFLRRQLKPGM